MRPPGRPAGDIREAARQAAWAACAAGQAELVTWRHIGEALVPQGVGLAAVRATVKNMVRAGELQPEQPVRMDGVARALMGYRPVLPGRR